MDDGPADALRLDLTRDPVVVAPLPGLSQVSARDQCASVLLPPAQAQRVMIMGGAPGRGDAVKNVDIVDFSQPHPAYRPAASLAKGRKHLNATLLPDRTVLVTGGSGRNEAAPLATNEAEVYDPETDTWRTLATASVTRMYHSVALLLPDGRVVTAANPKQGTHVQWDSDPNEEMRLQIYSPPYLFKGPRPVISAVRTEWRYGQTVNISSPDAGHVQWVSLIRPGSTTHSFNTSQRLVDLPIAAQAAGSVQVTVPAEPNLAPPGWYMPFHPGNNTVPSVARWAHLAGAPDTALPGSPYNHAVLGTPALAGDWPLAEARGTVAYDVFGANHGSYIGHPALGAPGAKATATAVALNGRDQYVLLPRLVTDDFSLELWFSSRAAPARTSPSGGKRPDCSTAKFRAPPMTSAPRWTPAARCVGWHRPSGHLDPFPRRPGGRQMASRGIHPEGVDRRPHPLHRRRAGERPRRRHPASDPPRPASAPGYCKAAVTSSPEASPTWPSTTPPFPRPP